MSPKSLLVLTSVAALALVIAIVLIFTNADSGVDRADAGELMFPAFNERIDDLARVEIETSTYTLALEQRDDVWVATGLGDYPVNADSLLQIVTSLASMVKIEPKTADPALYAFIDVNGPDDPDAREAIRITGTATDGDQLLDAIIGAQSGSIGYTRFGGSFVRNVDEDQTWLVEGVIRAPSFVQDWFASLVGIPGPNIASVSILTGDELMFTVEKVNFDTADYELTFLNEAVAPADAAAEADDARIRSLTQGIVSTIFESARAINSIEVTPEDRVVRFVTRDEMELTVRMILIDDVYWVTYLATAPEGTEAAVAAAEINGRTARWAFQIPSYRIDALNRPLEELIIIPTVAPEVDPELPGLIIPGGAGDLPGELGVIPQ